MCMQLIPLEPVTVEEVIALATIIFAVCTVLLWAHGLTRPSETTDHDQEADQGQEGSDD